MAIPIRDRKSAIIFSVLCITVLPEPGPWTSIKSRLA
jgi:hypothetical protein